MAVLATDGGSSYYHWMVDVLPRIHLLKEAGLFDKIETFVLPPMNSDFQRETLHLLKLPAEKMIFADSRDFAVTADHVFVPSLPSRLGVIEAWTCMYLQEAFSEWRAQDGASPRKIYISRDDAPIRRVTAAAQFKARLLEAGYTEILCSEHSVEEQIKLFANATHVVAPHGGGLTNILFCEPGTKVLDIFPSSFVIPCYWSLSNRVGLRYHCYSDGPVENAFSPYWVNEDRNISIDDRFWPLFYEFDKSG
ncbi:MAG: glycosyltransferase family 61 protein [Pseudomonadota bacterium]